MRKLADWYMYQYSKGFNKHLFWLGTSELKFILKDYMKFEYNIGINGNIYATPFFDQIDFVVKH